MVFAICLALSAGCIQKNHQVTDSQSMVQAQMMLDQRNYSSAILKYEQIVIADPSNETAKIKLFHAYAGAGGFEALSLVDVLKAAENKIAEVQNREKEKVKNKIKQKTIQAIENSIDELSEILSPIPTLTEIQKVNLNKALSLYQELGLKIDTAGSYNNFKWGTLHAFRLAVNLKDMVVNLQRSKDVNHNFDLSLVEKAIMSHSKEMGTDFFQVVKLYSNSYTKFKLIHEKIENLIGKTINSPSFKLKINSLATDEKDFYQSFIKDNTEAITSIVSEYISNYTHEVKSLVGKSDKILPPTIEIEATTTRIKALISLAVRQFTIEQPDAEVALKELFSSQTKQELYQSLIDSINNEDLSNVKSFILSKEGKLNALVSYARLLSKNITESGIDTEIRNEINALAAKVDQQVLISELTATAMAIELAQEAAVSKLAILSEEDMVLLENHSVNLNLRIQEINDYLQKPVDELSQALNSNIPAEDQIQINKIIASVTQIN